MSLNVKYIHGAPEEILCYQAKRVKQPNSDSNSFKNPPSQNINTNTNANSNINLNTIFNPCSNQQEKKYRAIIPRYGMLTNYSKHASNPELDYFEIVEPTVKQGELPPIEASTYRFEKRIDYYEDDNGNQIAMELPMSSSRPTMISGYPAGLTISTTHDNTSYMWKKQPDAVDPFRFDSNTADEGYGIFKANNMTQEEIKQALLAMLHANNKKD